MFKHMRTITAVVAGLGLATLAFAADAPRVISKSAEELVSANGRLSSIAVDSLDQPHLVCDGGSMAYFYDKIGGTWRTSSLNMPSVGYRQYFNPHMEIDSLDRAWVSGIMVDGFGTIIRENLKDNPSGPYFSNQRVGGVWDSGNISIDPVYPNEGVLMSAYGMWKKVIYSASSPSRVVVGANGTMFAGRDGEKKGFWIDKWGGAKAHADGSSHSVWHLAVSGYSGDWPCTYQNSIRSAQNLPIVPWVAFKAGLTDTMGDDGTYDDVVSDRKDPMVAYMATDFSIGGKFGGTDGVVMNIFNGSAMVFNPNSVPPVDRDGSSGMRRYAPQLAAAKDGGVYISWTHGSVVKLAYFSPTGQKGWEETVASGSLADITTDSKGNIHIVYNNNGIRYQKWSMSGSVSASSMPGDFNGDGTDDIALFDASTAKWYIQSIATTNTFVNGRTFGYVGGTPIIGDFNGDGASDIGVFDPASNRWTAQSIATTTVLFTVTYGASGSIPVVGDFNGDGLSDIGFWNPANGQWSAKNPITDTVFLNGHPWGSNGMTPVVADYNGDGIDDLGLYNSSDSKWYIRSITDLTGALVNGTVLGAPGSTPVPADFDGDDKAELAAVNLSTFFWLSQPVNNLNGPITARQWGFSGCRPVVGDFNGDGKADIAIWNPADGRWYIRASDPIATKSWAMQSWGYNGATLVPEEYNNDGATELGVYGNGAWFIRGANTNNILAWNIPWGGFNGAIPCPGDFNGDGNSDLGIYDSLSGKWYIKSLDGSLLAWSRQWGYANTQPVEGDFNGDGTNDLAVFDAVRGKWFIQSMNGTVLAWDRNWGFNGARAYAGDFNGDGKDDLAVFNPVNGKWYIQTVAGGNVVAWDLSWGFAGSTPVIADYNGDGSDDLAIYGNGSWYIYDVKHAAKRRDPILAWNHTWGLPGAIPVKGDVDGDGQADLIFFDPSTGFWYAQSLDDSNTTVVMGRQFGSATMTPIGAPAN